MSFLRRNNKQSGFTLMELLIVIAVLGLLLGMLIPRLGGVTDDTVDTVCDTNNKGIRYFVQNYYNKYGSMPNGLTNLVDATAGFDAAVLPKGEDPDTGGAEAIASEFWTRNWPGLYELNADEVAELKDMGLTSVYAMIGDNRPMEKRTITAGDGVMMMGISHDGSAYAYTAETATQNDGDSTADETLNSGNLGIGNPFWLGRIMMAVNDQCDLVKKGMIQASALCPGAVLAKENFSVKEYVIVLPRLAATVEAVAGTMDGATHTAGGIATLEPDETLTFRDASAADDTSGRNVSFEFSAQAGWEFDMSCPEGHKWPDNDEELWVPTSSSGL